MSSKKKVNWEGSFFIEHSLAKVNREICKRLIKEKHFDIGTIPYEYEDTFLITDELSSIRDLHVNQDDCADITIRHQWPPNFQHPRSDKWILFQPWEFGAIPKDWYVPMKDHIDEIWVYSTYNKDAYVRSGIPGHKIKVIPLGVDPDIFHYDVKSMNINTKKTFQFLFVGGTIFRKGIDLLLKAYLEEFSANEDVCLVIKDFGTGSFYKGSTIGEWIAERQNDSNIPEILYLQETFSEKELAGLYKTCDCLVHPYRGEGFGLPIIESMACGTPVIVPSLGPARDFCHEDFAFFVDCQEESWPTKAIGEIETVDAPWWLKVDVNDLRKQMRAVFMQKQLLEQRGRKASEHILANFTWDMTAKIVEEMLGDNANIINEETQQKSSTDETATNMLAVFYQKALFFINEKDYIRALSYLYQIKNRMQDETKQYQAEIWNAIGVCSTKLREFEKAHEAFQIAVKRDASNIELAIECYKKILSDPNIPALQLATYHNSLGTLYFENGNDLEAERIFRRELEQNPESNDIKEKLAALKQRFLDYHEKYIMNQNDYEILWSSPILNASGYAEEQKEFLHGLKSLPLKIKLDGYEIEPKPEIQSVKTLQYVKSLKENHLEHPLIHYQAGPAYQFSTPKAPISIGRTMFETDRVPDGWLQKMEQLSEIWVPSEFNKKTFSDAGLAEKKIFIVPGTIDVQKYNPDKVKQNTLKTDQNFQFLSVFDWSLRKGWDVLIRAYLEEFRADENVSLVLKVYKMLHSHANPYEDIVRIAQKIGKTKFPQIKIIDHFFTGDELIQLYADSDCYVMPSRGEGWGRPYMEAMAMGLPTIGTRWSAQVDFMNDENSYLIDVEKLTAVDPSMPIFYNGHRWADPSIEHLKQLMRTIFDDQEEAKQVGKKAREHIVSHYSQEKVANRMYQRFDELIKEHYGKGG